MRLGKTEAHTAIRGVSWPSFGEPVNKFAGEIPDLKCSPGTGPVTSPCQSKRNDFSLSAV